MYAKVFVLCFVLFSLLSPLSLSQEISLFPDMPKITEIVLQATMAVAQNIPVESGYVQIQSVQIEQLKSLSFMLSEDIDERTYLIYFTADTGFWKTRPHVLILLDKFYNPLFTLHGGYNGNGIDFNIVDINSEDGQREILVNDYASGNQSSQTRTFILRYDIASNRFLKVFDQVIKQTGMDGFSSKLTFAKDKGNFSDIMIGTQVILRYDGDNERVENTESRFVWDGKQYVGSMNLPETMKQRLLHISYPTDGLIEIPKQILEKQR